MARVTLSLALAAIVAATGCDRAAPPHGAAASDRLLIWSSVDVGKTRALLADFHVAHPATTIAYVEMPAQTLNARFLDAADHRRPLPDILWSSAMDLQIKLTNDGYAQAYVSPEASHLPSWANWKNEAWGTTAEPIVLIYNRRLVADAAVPRTHAALAALLERRRARSWIATYDVPRSAVGYLYLSQDAQASGDFWRLARAMGTDRVKLFVRAEDMLRSVARGDAAFGYDVVGSYALEEAEHDPRLGLVPFADYTLLMSRIALIPIGAPHPLAARLFVDHLLSRRGQSRLAEQEMPSVRSDVETVERLSMGDAPMRAIRVGPGLLVISDRLTRRHFLKRWAAAIRRP